MTQLGIFLGNMFFYLSKFLWFIVVPGNLIVLGIVIGIALLWTRWHRFAKSFLGFIALVVLFITIVPIGPFAVSVFEDRFPKPQISQKKITGIIVLGGVVSPGLSASRGELSFGTATERLVAFANLAKQHPDAKLVFTGGSGDPFYPELSEAHIIRPFLASMGINLDRVIFEGKSRNTVENAQLTYELLNPTPTENWVLITSAFHMPRAVGCFRKVGWNAIPYPVDYGTMAGNERPSLHFNFTKGLSYLNAAVHEALGLIAYYVTGKTDALFPAPR